MPVREECMLPHVPGGERGLVPPCVKRSQGPSSTTLRGVSRSRPSPGKLAENNGGVMTVHSKPIRGASLLNKGEGHVRPLPGREPLPRSRHAADGRTCRHTCTDSPGATTAHAHRLSDIVCTFRLRTYTRVCVCPFSKKTPFSRYVRFVPSGLQRVNICSPHELDRIRFRAVEDLQCVRTTIM